MLLYYHLSCKFCALIWQINFVGLENVASWCYKDVSGGKE